MARKRSILIALMVIFLMAGLVMAGRRTAPTRVGFDESGPIYMQEAPLWLSGNDALSGYPGNGSAQDPFWIGNLTIDGWQGNYCIFLENIDAYFILSNCTLFNVSSGIALKNVTHGLVMNNTIQNATRGISLGTSFLNNISLNDLSLNHQGISSFLSYNNTIFHNLIYGNEEGIYLSQSHNNTISDNNLSDNTFTGITLMSADDNRILSNTFQCNGEPWSDSDGEGNIFARNTVESCNNIGLPAPLMILLTLMGITATVLLARKGLVFSVPQFMGKNQEN